MVTFDDVLERTHKMCSTGLFISMGTASALGMISEWLYLASRKREHRRRNGTSPDSVEPVY
jgi:hypothetical protein